MSNHYIVRLKLIQYFMLTVIKKYKLFFKKIKKHSSSLSRLMQLQMIAWVRYYAWIHWMLKVSMYSKFPDKCIAIHFTKTDEKILK